MAGWRWSPVRAGASVARSPSRWRLVGCGWSCSPAANPNSMPWRRRSAQPEESRSRWQPISPTRSRAGTAVRRGAAEMGEIGVLINNAAVVAPLGPTASLDLAVVAAALRINVLGVIGLSGVLLAPMLASGWGRIVNVSSGIVARPEMMVGATVYAATKAAVEAHTINLAAELAGTGVTANVYRPGSVDTAMQEWIRNQPPDEIGAALHERFVESHAQGTLITPERSAASLVARLSSESSGQVWDVADSEIAA